MRTGSPMSSTKVSPSSAMLADSMTNPTASSTVMKNRVTSGCVTVTASPFSICSDSTDRNEPRLPRTLPKRTDANLVNPPACACTIISATRFDAPRIDIGSAALSVEIRMNRSTPVSTAASTRCLVPMTLDLIPSHGLRSRSGRCLCAAAWNTTSNLRSSKSCLIRWLSLMSAINSSSLSSRAWPSSSI